MKCELRMKVKKMKNHIKIHIESRNIEFNRTMDTATMNIKGTDPEKMTVWKSHDKIYICAIALYGLDNPAMELKEKFTFRRFGINSETGEIYVENTTYKETPIGTVFTNEGVLVRRLDKAIKCKYWKKNLSNAKLDEFVPLGYNEPNKLLTFDEKTTMLTSYNIETKEANIITFDNNKLSTTIKTVKLDVVDAVRLRISKDRATGQYAVGISNGIEHDINNAKTRVTHAVVDVIAYSDPDSRTIKIAGRREVDGPLYEREYRLLIKDGEPKIYEPVGKLPIVTTIHILTTGNSLPGAKTCCRVRIGDMKYRSSI